MKYLPISLDLVNQTCLIVGGGGIAYRKAKLLVSAGANIIMVAPEFEDNLIALATEHSITLNYRNYVLEDLTDIRLVIAATDDIKVNSKIAKDAEEKMILVNVVDEKALCRFITPSIIDRSPLTLAISSSGSAPVFARMLREKLEWMLPDNIGELLENIGNKRKLVANRFPSMTERRTFWESYFESRLNWSVADNVSIHTDLDPNDQLEDWLDKPLLLSNNLKFIDIGSGDNDDLTVKILKSLQKADMIFLPTSLQYWAKNLVRKDADVQYLNDTAKTECENGMLDDNQLTLILDKASSYRSSIVIFSGNHFEEFEKRYSDQIEKIIGSEFKAEFKPESKIGIEFIRGIHPKI